MKIEILGPGCSKCNSLEANAKAAADKLGIPYELVHVKDIAKIASYGVLMTPALAVDGKVKLSGTVASPTELTTLFTAELKKG
ncbi:MAG: thioredoxin family protein [Planctomycetota bacterium]